MTSMIPFFELVKRSVELRDALNVQALEREWEGQPGKTEFFKAVNYWLTALERAVREMEWKN